MSQQEIADAIYTKLSGDSGAGGVSTLTGGRIWEGLATQNADLPLVTFNIITDPEVDYFNGEDVDIEFQLDMWGDIEDGGAALRAVADRCRTLMHKQAITVANHTNGKTRCKDRGQLTPDDTAYRITQRYQLTATVN